MGRMTEKGPNGYYVPANRGGAAMIYAPQAEVKQRYEGEIVDRLGEYEQTGYEPTDFDNLCREMSNLRMSLGYKTYEQMKEHYVDAITKYQELLYDLCFDDNGSQVVSLDEIIALAKAKKEGRCIVTDSPISGTAQVLVDGKLEDRKVKEVVAFKTGEAIAVTVLVDKGKGKKEYPEYILRHLRRRMGMEPDDTSRDEIFQGMEPKRVFKEVLIWNGLLSGWDRQIIGWIKDIYGVDLEG